MHGVKQKSHRHEWLILDAKRIFKEVCFKNKFEDVYRFPIDHPNLYYGFNAIYKHRLKPQFLFPLNTCYLLMRTFLNTHRRQQDGMLDEFLIFNLCLGNLLFVQYHLGCKCCISKDSCINHIFFTNSYPRRNKLWFYGFFLFAF